MSVGVDTPVALAQSAARVTAGNLASRITGLLRVLAVGAVLGATFLGNTYQSSNLVSNLLFELLAAGIISSVLVPPFVKLLDNGQREEAEQVAGNLLGIGLAVLAVVCVIAIVARTWIMELLTITVPDPAVRAAEIRLGSFLLVLFVPQVLLYATGSVATALLHGARRFSAVAFAPVANNVAVIATMALFWWVSGGSADSVSGTAGLDLTTTEKLVLAIGTTAGVAAMSLIPLVDAWRAGLRLRPRWNPRHPGVRALGRAGLWAAAYLALAQVLIALTLVLANRVEGGVVAYQIAFALFLLPHALLAQPLITVLYPRIAAEALAARWREFSHTLAKGLRWIMFVTAPAAALLFAAAGPGLDLVRFGHLDDAGANLVANVTAAYALGIVGYAALLLVTRASYGAGDVRTPALVNLAVAAGGSFAMVGLFGVASGTGRVVVLGVAYAAAVSMGALCLYLLLIRHRAGPGGGVGAALIRAAAAGVTAGGVGRAVVALAPWSGRSGAMVALGAGAVATGLAYAAAQRVMGAPEFREGRELLADLIATRCRRRVEAVPPPRALPAPAGPVVALVPAKDAAETIGATVNALQRVSGLTSVIVVDDGSADSTARAAAHAGARVVRLDVNEGKGGALAAGVAAAPDAGIYLLVDADVGASAMEVAALLEPVTSGEAAVAVGVLPPAGPGGGFGLVRALAARGIELATGRSFEAPLSGQRAVNASLLRQLELSSRFGVDVAMTIDTLAAGYRVVEVPVQMGHREWGRGARGTAHRARQGADIVRALWPRLTSFGFRAATIVTLFAVATAALVVRGSSYGPRTVTGSDRPAKVLLLGIPSLGIDALTSGTNPNLERLAARGAVGGMHVRTVSSEPSAVEAFAALGAGSKVQAPPGEPQLSTDGTGATVMDAARFRQVNDDHDLPTLPGALGDAVVGAGRRTAAVGGPTAAVAVMGSTGRVGYASSETSNVETLVADTVAALGAADLVVVDPSELVSVDVDDVVGRLSTVAGPEVLFVVAGMTPPGKQWRLTPLVMAGPSVVSGTLYSPGTRQPGLVKLIDLAPMALSVLGAKIPAGMTGTPLRFEPGKHNVNAIASLDEAGAFRQQVFAPAVLSFVVGQVLIYGLALLVLRRTVAGLGRRLLQVAALAVVAFPLASFALRLVPAAQGLGTTGGVVLIWATAAALVALARCARRHPLSPLAWLLGATIAVLVVDVATGGRLQMASIIGPAPQTTGRFFGFNNQAFAVLAATTLLASALHVHHAPRRREAVITVALLFLLVVLVDGLPMLGADVGGILTLVPVFTLTVLALAYGRLTWRAVFMAAGLAAAGVAVATGIDFLAAPESRTHLAHFISDTSRTGQDGLWTTITRRAEANVNRQGKLLVSWILPVVATGWLFHLVRRTRWTSTFPIRSALRVGLVATLAAGLAGFVLNDSGVVVTALALSYGGAFTMLVALVRPRAASTVSEPASDQAPAVAAAAEAAR